MGRLVVLLCLLGSLDAKEADLTTLSLEEFLNVEVTSVRRSRQKLSRTAAAVFVITRDDIRRSGATSLPELLRLAPGVQVSRISGTTWAVGIRGFNALYTNKLLVMIDGRTLYHPLLSGVMWSQHLIPLEEIDRVEVIRGPGATIWGANAVSGVINIITMRAEDMQGGSVTVASSNTDPVRNRIGYGGRMGETMHWRSSVSYTRLGQMDPSGNEGRRPMNDTGMAGFRVEGKSKRGDDWMVDSGLQYGNFPLEQVVAGNAGPPEILNLVGGSRTAYVMGRVSRSDEMGNERTVQMYYDERRTDAGVFGTNLRMIDIDLQRTRVLRGGHQLMLSGGFRSSTLETAGTRYFQFDPEDATYRTFNAVVQDEWQIQPDRLYLTAGTKVEHYSRTGINIQPSVRVLWVPAKRVVAWGAYSHAVRTPSHVDFALRLPLVQPGVPLPLQLRGNQEADPERLDAVESGIRWQVGKRLGLDMTVFRHRYLDLMAFAPQPPVLLGGSLVLPALTVNGRQGRNQGAEAVMYLEMNRKWQVSATYSGLWTSIEPSRGYTLSNTLMLPTYDPRHQGYVRSTWDLGRHWSADVTVYRRGALDGNLLPGSTRADFRIARSVGESTEISLSGQNLFRAGQSEYPGSLLVHTERLRRSVGVTLTHRF